MNGEISVRRGASGDRVFAQDLGERTMTDSVAPMRSYRPGALAASYAMLLDFVFDQSHLMLVAERGGRRVGFLLLLDSIPDEVTRMPQAFVAYMAVEPEERRRGVASLLLSAAEDEARRRGLPYIGLMVTETNAAARALYERAGYLTERRLLCKPL